MAETKSKPHDKPDPEPSTERPKRFPSNIPHVEDKQYTTVAGSTRPKLEDYDEGVYLRKSDGEEYALAIVKDDPIGRNFKAMNTVHSWEGTKEQFIKDFNQKNGSPIDPDKFKKD